MAVILLTDSQIRLTNSTLIIIIAIIIVQYNNYQSCMFLLHCLLILNFYTASWRKLTHFIIERTLLYWKRKGIRIEKREKLLGLAGGNTKKRGNKKSGECITPIRYNVIINMYSYMYSVDTLASQVNCQSLHVARLHPSVYQLLCTTSSSMSPSWMDELCVYALGIRGKSSQNSNTRTFGHYTHSL